MKQKIIKLNTPIEIQKTDDPCGIAGSYSAEESICCLVYSYPFIAMIDLTIVFDELKKKIEKWFLHKKGHTIRYKKEINEAV